MAKEEKESAKDKIANPIPKEGPIDLAQRVEVTTTDSAPYHKANQKIKVAPAVAEKMKANGWAKLIVIAFMAFGSLACNAQVNMLSTFGLASDTVVNAATSFLTVRNAGAKQETIVQVVCTEISGTTGGTISLLGSIDGTNFVALQAEEVSTAIPTKTALDVASQTFLFRVKGNPATHYRVSWTGTGTMSARFSAKLMSH